MGKKEYYEFDVDSNQIKPMSKKKLATAFANVDKWKAAKIVVTSVASGCASIVMGKYLKSNMPEAKGIFDKAVMDIGMYCITGAVAKMVSKQVDKEMDDLRESLTVSVDVETDILGGE